jgi:hypothetical protein
MLRMAAMARTAATLVGTVVITGLAPVALAVMVAAVPVPASARAAARAAVAVPGLQV